MSGCLFLHFLDLQRNKRYWRYSKSWGFCQGIYIRIWGRGKWNSPEKDMAWRFSFGLCLVIIFNTFSGAWTWLILKPYKTRFSDQSIRLYKQINLDILLRKSLVIVGKSRFLIWIYFIKYRSWKDLYQNNKNIILFH